MIHRLRMTKQSDYSEYHRLMQIDERFRPDNIDWNGGLLSWDYIDGAPPTKVRPVIEAAEIAMWCGEPKLAYDIERYIAYVSALMPAVEGFLRANLWHVTPVRFCHGDLTLQNVVQGDGIYFIDPCDCHGLPCREMDESKIMQSLDGFGGWTRGLPQPECSERFEYRREHWALLVSHYVRMLRHQDEHGRSFAHRRIREITCLHTS